MDARRQQVYTGIYEFIGEELRTIEPQCAIGIDALVQKINALDREVIFLGDGADAFAEYIRENCTVPFHFAPAHMNKQKASSVAALGKKLYEQGCFETAAEHRPDYLRLSQAERERQEKERDFRI
jgi:tRNA threonylcarbamoyladenosine biosynthesis protein TsaB